MRAEFALHKLRRVAFEVANFFWSSWQGGVMREHDRLAEVVVRPGRLRSRHTVLLSDAILSIGTVEPIQFVDLTDRINQFLASQRIEHGEATVFSRHTTAAIKINEAEELLLEDFRNLLSRLCPQHDGYNHNDMSRRKPPIAPDERPNGHSHCMHLLLSTSETIPVIDARLALGTWQRVFLVELDGPRRREVFLRCASFAPFKSVAPIRPRQIALNDRASNATPAGGR
ncbi:MAG: secondary thiamine-phosphate synthase enzyme YjbQ [Candidatus Binataceae bacterium]